jgi:uncharacterized membrane protein
MNEGGFHVMKNQCGHVLGKKALLTLLCTAGLSLMMFFSSFAAGGLEMSTSYPGVSAKPGSTLNFALDFMNSGTGVNAALTADSAPSGWKCYFEGNGNQISNVYVKSGDNKALASFNVSVPADAANGTYNINLHANGSGVSSDIALKININEGDVGSSKFSAENAKQEGTSTSTFSFSTAIQNNSSNKQSFSLSSKAPSGWKVSFMPSGQTNAASSTDVNAHGSQTVAVTVTPPQDAAAGDYTIPVSAVSGNESLSTELKVTITGKYELKLQTPTQVLSFNATANQKTPVTVDVVNSGNIPLQNINLSAEAPTGWNVGFSESTIDTLEAGATKEITMNVTPSKDALSGDYAFNVTAKSSDANNTVAFRTTVKTQTSWGIFAVILILLIVGCISLVFHKFGRH